MKAEFSLSAHSGLIAGTVSANSVLFAWRNPATLIDGSTNALNQRIKLLVVKYRTITGFPTAQEVAIGAYEVSAFGSTPANYSGGTDLSDQTTTNAIRRIGPDLGPKPLQTSVLVSGNVRIGTTSELTHGGTPTIATHPFAWDAYFELAAASTVQEGAFDLIWSPSLESVDGHKGLLLQPNKGFVLRNPIALGATGTCRIFVEVFWEEA